jgi:hypothetical protein
MLQIVTEPLIQVGLPLATSFGVILLSGVMVKKMTNRIRTMNQEDMVPLDAPKCEEVPCELACPVVPVALEQISEVPEQVVEKVPETPAEVPEQLPAISEVPEVPEQIPVVPEVVEKAPEVPEVSEQIPAIPEQVVQQLPETSSQSADLSVSLLPVVDVIGKEVVETVENMVDKVVNDVLKSDELKSQAFGSIEKAFDIVENVVPESLKDDVEKIEKIVQQEVENGIEKLKETVETQIREAEVVVEKNMTTLLKKLAELFFSCLSLKHNVTVPVASSHQVVKGA